MVLMLRHSGESNGTDVAAGAAAVDGWVVRGGSSRGEAGAMAE
jgi:hypothetical protein